MRADGKATMDLTFVDGKVFSGDTVVWVVPDRAQPSDGYSEGTCLRYGRMCNRRQAVAFLDAIAKRHVENPADDPYMNIHRWQMGGESEDDLDVAAALCDIIEHSDEVFHWKDELTVSCGELELHVDNSIHGLAAQSAGPILKFMSSSLVEAVADFARKAL